MEIERARELGLCFGVRRAVTMLQDAASTCPRIETLGPIAHNQVLMRQLEDLGVVTVNSSDDLCGPLVVISAHGLGPERIAELEARGLDSIDTTCPIVARAQAIGKQLAGEGFTVVIYGDSAHTEVKGLMGWAGDQAVASMDGQALLDSGALDSARKVAVIAQTTQPVDDFARFVATLCETLSTGTVELRVVNTLCAATRNRLCAAVDLAHNVDVMLVVGGKNSANTRRLAEGCARIVETHHIEAVDEMEDIWFKGKKKVGITAGASTPDSSIEEVEARVRELQPS